MAATAQPSIEDDFQEALRTQNAGHFRDAGKLYRQVLARDPDHVFAYNNLGMVVAEEAGPGAAVPLYWNALRLDPTLADAHNNLGNAFMSMNLLAEAEEHFRRAIAMHPTKPFPHYNLGNLCLTLRRNDEAERSFAAALAIDPDYCDAINNRGNALRNLGRYDEALAAFKRTVEIDPKFAFGHIGIGNILRDKDDLEGALPHYRRAVTCVPNMAIAHFNLANALRDLGLMKPAEESFRKAIELNPKHADAYRHLVEVARLDPDDVLVVAMQSGFESTAAGDKSRMHYGFALGSVFDRAGRHDEAYRYFAEANRLKRKSVEHDSRADAELLESVRTVFSPDSFPKLPNSQIDDETPIFIIGMMRSGTTLTEQILASHPEVAAAGELRVVQEIIDSRSRKTGKPYPQSFEGVAAADLREMGESYISRVRAMCGSGARFITDKMPQNFLYAGAMRLMLPKARFIYLTRDPMDVGLSVFTIHFTHGHHYAYDLREIGAYIRHSEGMMAHWRRLFPSAIYHQEYEKLVDDSEAQIRKLLDFCGLPFDQKCLDFHKTKRIVRTASATQVRERLNKNSVARWKPYERHLRDLKQTLKDS